MAEAKKIEQYLKDIYNTELSQKKKNHSVGIDGTTHEKFLAKIDEEVNIMARKFVNETYQLSFYKEKLILKGRDSKPRVISIPTNRDKLLLKILQLNLKETYKDELGASSIHRKIKDIKQKINSQKYNSFIKLDIQSFFDNIDHDILLSLLKKKGISVSIYALLEKAIKQATVAVSDSQRKKLSNTKGVPQGLSISGILADIYLQSFDNKHKKSNHYHYYRFVDDMLILCNKDDIDNLMKELNSDLKLIGLDIHKPKENSQKTDSGDIKAGFQFLGYQFKGALISVRPLSIDKAYKGINKVFLKFHKYTDKEDLNELYKRLNLKITGCVVNEKQYGWLYFFSFINDKTLLHKLDAYVKKACKRFNVPYDTAQIKKYSRTYFELINMDKSNYIPKFNNPIALGIYVKEQPRNDVIANNIGAEIIEGIEDDIEFY